MVPVLGDGSTRISILIRHLMQGEDDYEVKMELFDELISILIHFKEYGLLSNNGFHNEELTNDLNHVELISIPIAQESFDMHFDYSLIIDNLIKKLENVLNHKSFAIEENFAFENMLFAS
ncbi:MAG: hypothetical protein ACXAE3_02160 [Candidatus Kariarchaeaceae archaeon]|jgi:hypothetical protein